MASAKRLAKRIYNQNIGERTATPMILEAARKEGMSNAESRKFYGSVQNELRRLSGQGTSGANGG